MELGKSLPAGRKRVVRVSKGGRELYHTPPLATDHAENALPAQLSSKPLCFRADTFFSFALLPLHEHRQYRHPQIISLTPVILLCIAIVVDPAW